MRGPPFSPGCRRSGGVREESQRGREARLAGDDGDADARDVVGELALGDGPRPLMVPLRAAQRAGGLGDRLGGSAAQERSSVGEARAWKESITLPRTGVCLFP